MERNRGLNQLWGAGIDISAYVDISDPIMTAMFLQDMLSTLTSLWPNHFHGIGADLGNPIATAVFTTQEAAAELLDSWDKVFRRITAERGLDNRTKPADFSLN